MKIYLAGKISRVDWRHDLVTHGDLIMDNPDEYYKQGWPTIPRSIFGEHDYTGPYFLDDCGGHAYAEGEHYAVSKVEGAYGATMQVRRRIVELCFDAIK